MVCWRTLGEAFELVTGKQAGCLSLTATVEGKRDHTPAIAATNTCGDARSESPLPPMVLFPSPVNRFVTRFTAFGLPCAGQSIQCGHAIARQEEVRTRELSVRAEAGFRGRDRSPLQFRSNCDQKPSAQARVRKRWSKPSRSNPQAVEWVRRARESNRDRRTHSEGGSESP